MRFFKKLLGGFGVPVGHAEWRRFQVPFVPEPGNLHKLADVIVETTQRIEGVALDYTPESLKEVDKILLRFHEDGMRVRYIADPLFCLGCYVGEVMCRRLGARWVEPPEPILGIFPVTLIGGSYSTPITKTYKHVMNGSEDSVYVFYRMIERGAMQKSDEGVPSGHEGV